MFSWFRRRTIPNATPPQPSPRPSETPPAPAEKPRRAENAANPGISPTGRIAFNDGRRTWEESVDGVALLARALLANGYEPSTAEQVVHDETSGLLFRPLLVESRPTHGKGVRTVTTIEVKHPSVIPSPVFEFQHSTGDSTPESIAEGFDQWCKTDLVALVDATLPQPKSCMTMLMELPATQGRPARKRRVLFGPVAHLRQNVAEPVASGMHQGGEGDEHEFCPCCLFTRAIEAFKPLLEADGFFGLRLFAMRDAQGAAGADCRINGEDFDAGKERLKAYVGTWPDAGVEFRKQYVILQNA